MYTMLKLLGNILYFCARKGLAKHMIVTWENMAMMSIFLEEPCQSSRRRMGTEQQFHVSSNFTQKRKEKLSN